MGVIVKCSASVPSPLLKARGKEQKIIKGIQELEQPSQSPEDDTGYRVRREMGG